MTFTQAAAQVLRLVGKPLHYKEITDVAIEKDLLSHVGKSPEVTMGARLAALVKKDDKDNPLMRVKPGVFALKEWDKDTVDKGLTDRTPALEIAKRVESESDSPPTESDAPAMDSSSPVASDDELSVPDEDERVRAEIAAHATDLFENEDDDDEPIFSALEALTGEINADRERDDGTRRRRRRRRRGRGTNDESRGGDELPGYTVSDAPANLTEELIAERPARQQRERGGPSKLAVDDLAGRSLADAIAETLSGFDRQSPVGVQRLVEGGGGRRGRGSESGSNAGAVMAAVRADNLRRSSEGKRPRFRYCRWAHCPDRLGCGSGIAPS